MGLFDAFLPHSHTFSAQGQIMQFSVVTLFKISLPMIIWIILQDEILAQVSTDGTRLPVSENKKNSLQFSFVFFLLFAVCVSHFAADASGISGEEPLGINAPKTFLSK